jgi:hypothetical protein
LGQRESRREEQGEHGRKLTIGEPAGRAVIGESAHGARNPR